MKKGLSILLVLALLLAQLPVHAGGLPLQDCHRVDMTWSDTSQVNGSVVRVWKADTALDAVDSELASITDGYVSRLAGILPSGSNATSASSRLDVQIRYSRTGTSWMSFAVQARTSYHRELKSQEITTRTYDMLTGRRIMLTDIFPEESFAWFFLGSAVYEQITAYWPDEKPDEAAMQRLTSREGLEQLDFTLHGMSLVLHVPASLVYPTHHTLLNITFYYPQIRGYMTEEAAAQTNNDELYNVAALTYDDGPNRISTTKLLNNLMQYGAVGTFFVVGNRISGFSDLVQREHDEGHSVGGHNWTHGNIRKMTGERLKKIPGQINEALIKAIGIPIRYDRVPYGLYNRMINAGVGMSYIQWSLDTYDWRGLSSAEILREVKTQIADGDIILCHDTKEKTPDTTVVLVKWLQENGYMLLTIDELFAKNGIEFKPDTVLFHNADGDTSLKQR